MYSFWELYVFCGLMFGTFCVAMLIDKIEWVLPQLRDSMPIEDEEDERAADFVESNPWLIFIGVIFVSLFLWPLLIAIALRR